LLCIEDQKTDSGQFYKFEVISFCPIDLRAIDAKMLSDKQIIWLNEYHAEVYDKLNPYLEDDLKKWLKTKTAKI